MNGVRLLRALSRSPQSVARHLADHIADFLAPWGDTPELRRAWTEPLSGWIQEADVTLGAPESLFWFEWEVALEDGSGGRNRIDVVSLTTDLAICELRASVPFGHLPALFGVLPRHSAANSFVLLFASLETELWRFESLVRSRPSTNLPPAAFVRIAYSRDVEPEVLFRMPDEELTRVARDSFPFLNEHPPEDLRLPPPRT